MHLLRIFLKWNCNCLRLQPQFCQGSWKPHETASTALNPNNKSHQVRFNLPAMLEMSHSWPLQATWQPFSYPPTGNQWPYMTPLRISRPRPTQRAAKREGSQSLGAACVVLVHMQHDIAWLRGRSLHILHSIYITINIDIYIYYIYTCNACVHII